MITDESLDEVYQKLTPELQAKMAFECNNIEMPKHANLQVFMMAFATYGIKLKEIQERYRALI